MQVLNSRIAGQQQMADQKDEIEALRLQMRAMGEMINDLAAKNAQLEVELRILRMRLAQEYGDASGGV
jgi:flagellar biosynthesis regulator FlaF